MLLAGKSENSGPFKYFKYWFAVRYLVDVEGLTLAHVLEEQRSEAELLSAAVDALRHERDSPRKEKPTDRNP